MNQTYGHYGSSVSDMFSSLAAQAGEAAGSFFPTASRGASQLVHAAGSAAGAATNYAWRQEQAAKYALWCKQHPFACWAEKHPNWWKWLIGIGVLYVAYLSMVTYVSVKYVAPVAGRAAEAGAFGPEGIAVAQGARKAGVLKNGRRRRSNGHRSRVRRRGR